MYQLVYTSHATVPLSESALLTLLQKAQRWNEQQGITGVLLYSQDQFVQVLEGPAQAVTTLYQQVRRDVRHHSVIQLAGGPVPARRFGQWSMSFQAVAPAQLAQVQGYFAPEQLRAQHHERLLAADELLLDLIESFMRSSLEAVPSWR